MRVQNNAGSRIKRVSSPQADRRSVCVIRTTVDNISTDTVRRAGLSPMTELLVIQWCSS